MEGVIFLVEEALVVDVTVLGYCSSNLSHYVNVGTRHIPHLPYLYVLAQFVERPYGVIKEAVLTAAAAGPSLPLTLTLNFLP